MISNNRIANKKSSITDYLTKANSINSDCSMTTIAPSASHDTVAKLLQPPFSPPCLSLDSRPPRAIGFQSMPDTVLDELRKLQKQQQIEDFLHERHELKGNLSAMQSRHTALNQQEDAFLLETFKKQNAILWDRLKDFQEIVMNLEELNSKVVQTNAKLENDLRDQIKVNKNLIQRNTDIVLDTSAKDHQISVLKEQKKSLTRENAKLKNFLRQTDSCLDSLQNQQYALHLQQTQIQQKVITPNSNIKKRKIDDQWDGESECGVAKDDGRSQCVKEVVLSKVTDDCDVISINSTMEDDNNGNNAQKHALDHQNTTSP